MRQCKDYEKMSVFEHVMDALKEGMAHNRGELTLRTMTLPAPASRYSKAQVAAFRKKKGSAGN